MEPKESKKPGESREPEHSKGLMRGRKSKDPREPQGLIERGKSKDTRESR
jgi:hypothetical protein